MKSILSIVIAVLFSSLYSYAGSKFSDTEKGFRLVRLDYTNGSGEKAATFYDYNAKGLCETAIWELENGKRYSINFQSYDKNNNMIKKTREYSDHKNTVQLYTYDDEARLMKEEFILRDTSRGITTYEYNDKGQLVQMKCRAYNGWINGMIKIYYDNRGRKEKGELVKGDKVTATINYEYDANDNLGKETWKFEGGWEQSFNYIYDAVKDEQTIVYTSPNPFVINLNTPVKREDYSYGDKVGGPSYYNYGSSGKLVEKIYERSDGFKTNTFYVYGNNGILLRAFRRYSNGKTALFRFNFSNFKMTSKEFFMNDNNYGKDVFTYDGEGKLLRAELNNSDLWLTGTIEFENGNNNLPLKGIYKDVKGFYAEIFFSYDVQSLLKKIIWMFSDGEEQAYLYSY